NPRACFLVAGKGDAEEDIRRIFVEAGQENKLFKVDILKGNDLADCYAAMDLFVFASKSETQGLVLAEAMAAATPVVALNASGVREVVEDGKNGFLLGSDVSVASFAEAIAGYAARDSESRQAMARTAQASAANFSRQRSVARLLDLYERCRAKHPGGTTGKEGGRLEAVLNRLETEWDLLAEKLGAVAETFSKENGGGQS
ncbi:MAG: glycosyltransferase, partial [Deltaproteobacteria bacterium]